MTEPTPIRRGRPRGDPERSDVRRRLIRAGLEHVTEKGYAAAGVDEILRAAGLPKGSFYHYFRGKADFGLVLIDAYHRYFAQLIDGALRDPARPPLERLGVFVDTAARGMARHDFRRGCLVGNLGQEMSTLPEAFRARLIAALDDWQARTALCLAEARAAGDIAAHHDPARMAAVFWIGWEGAVLRAKLDRSEAPLRLFADAFLAGLRPTTPRSRPERTSDV